MILLGTLAIGLLAVLYALVAVFFLYMTYQERSRIGSGSPVFTACAYLLCLAWPLAFVATLVSVTLVSARAHSA